MPTLILKSALLAAVCALGLSGCSFDHPGPSYPVRDDNLPAPSGAATAKTAKSAPAQAQSKPQAPASPAPAFGITDEAPSPTAPVAKPERAPRNPLSAEPDASSTAAGEATDTPGSGFDNVDLVDDSLKTKVGILRVGAEPTATKLLSVFVGLKNKTTLPLDLEIETLYKDKAGNALNTGSWVQMTLKPHEKTEYRSASLSDAAADFLVRIRVERAPADTGDQ